MENIMELFMFAVFVLIIFMWSNSVKNRLRIINKSIESSMVQINVQLSSQFDALIELLSFIKAYDKQESENLIKFILRERKSIAVKSQPEEVISQEKIIAESLERISAMGERYPELNANTKYIDTMDAIKNVDSMVYISQLVYNDGVTKLNTEVNNPIVSIIAKINGISKKHCFN